MAEELRSSQVARNGAAIDRHERLSGALALAVDQLRHMFLARAAGAVHQDRHVRRRDEPHIFVELPRGIALPLDIVGHIPARSPGSLRRLFRRYREDIAHGRRGIKRLADLFQQFVGIDGLGDVVAGAEFHAAHGVLDLGIARHYDHGHFDPLPRHPLQRAIPSSSGNRISLSTSENPPSARAVRAAAALAAVCVPNPFSRARS